ncbi:MAG: hypothetical protein Q9192_005522, partial [Flavoplaca navasiana]
DLANQSVQQATPNAKVLADVLIDDELANYGWLDSLRPAYKLIMDTIASSQMRAGKQ